MLAIMANWFFGCSHRHTSFPITVRNGGGSRRPQKAETYVVCLDCGKRFAYDWAAMRIAKEPVAAAHGSRDQGGLPTRVPMPAANRLLQRLVHHG